MLSNMLYHGDNLIILRETLPDACVDLIYLDPPFNTNRRYHLSSTKKRMKHNRVFDDVWRWDDAVQACYVSLTDDHNAISDTLRGFALMLGKGAMLAYLVMMTARLLELCRVLKPTGSIYLHCDSAAGAQLKLLMDAVFGGENFRNEIIWHYKTGGMSKRWFGRKHDTIYFYTKSAEYTFNPQKEKSRLSHRYGFNNVDILRDENGYYTMVGMRDVWDIAALRGNQAEVLGYPTQKPEALLERIIMASSNEGHLVLDPFCGSGTTLAVAQRLKRRWIGIDINEAALDLCRRRMAL